MGATVRLLLTAAGRIARTVGAGGIDSWFAGTAVGVLAVGVVVALAGAAAGALALAVAGGAVAGAALTTLIAGGWVDGLAVLVLSLPLPSLLSSVSARLPPAAIVTAVVVVAWMLRRLPQRRPLQTGGLPRLPLIAFLVAVATSAVFATDRWGAAREVLNMASMLALLVIATDELSGRARTARSLTRLLAGVAGIAGGVAICEAIGVMPGSFPLAGTAFNRAALGFGWPNELGMFFALSLPLCVYSYQSAEGNWTRTLAVVGVFGCVMGLLSTFSRGSWLAVLVAPVILASTGGGRPRMRVWVFAVSAVVLLDVASGGAFSTRAINLVADDGVAQRAGLMVAGLLMFQDHPWVGVGPGGFETSLGQYGPQVPWLWDYVGTAHNAYIDIAAETGLFGLITFLVFMVSIMVGLFRSARRAQLQADTMPDEANLHRALLWSFVTFCTVAFTAWPFTHGLGQLTMLVAALGFSQDPSARRVP